MENWAYVASSADGSKLIVSAMPYSGVGNGRIITSTDSGVTWTERGIFREARGVASSADGSKLIAVVAGGQIYISNNSGVSWAPTENNRNWLSAACSADCNLAVAVDYGGRIYRMDNPFEPPPPLSRLTGGQYTSVELQYIGEGKFILLSQQGAITATQF